MELFDRLDEIGFPKPDLRDRAAFVRNMIFIHDLIVASEPLLQEAIDHADGELLEYLQSHIEEERGHAAWLADDLACLGVKVGTPSMIAAACAGAQYYLIRHASPYALLGYMAVLEGYPMPLSIVDDLEAIHGTQACRTLRYHAENDIEHRKDLVAMIERAPDEYHPLITRSAVQTLNLINIALN